MPRLKTRPKTMNGADICTPTTKLRAATPPGEPVGVVEHQRRRRRKIM